MARDIAPLTNALDETTPGNQNDVYTLLASWDRSNKAALERGGGGRFREVTKQRRQAYPPGVDDHHCSQVLATVVARYVIRTRIEQGPDAIPV